MNAKDVLALSISEADRQFGFGVESRAGAWNAICKLCLELGMELGAVSGVENVAQFILDLHNMTHFSDEEIHHEHIRRRYETVEVVDE